MKSFSTGSRGYEKMHNVKNNVKQLLMPWKRKLAELDGEEVQNNDDFGTHPVLQVRVIHIRCTDACGACSKTCRLAVDVAVYQPAVQALHVRCVLTMLASKHHASAVFSWYCGFLTIIVAADSARNQQDKSRSAGKHGVGHGMAS